MKLLPPTPIGAAISPAVASVPVVLNASPVNLTVQATFAYGSGGATVDAYVQTTFDGGVTWQDVANFHFTTAAAREIINLDAKTPVTTQVSGSDGALAANTAQDGILGPQLRVKYQSSGTYAGATSLRIDIASIDLPAFPA